MDHYERLLKDIGFGKAQYLIILVEGLLLMTFSAETMGQAQTQMASKCELQTDFVHRSILLAAPFAGFCLSAYPYGYIADKYGRRKPIIVGALMGFMSSLLSVMMQNYWTFVFWRFFTGFFLAVNATISRTYLSEFCDESHRAVIINFSAMFRGFGLMYSPLLGMCILPQNWKLAIFPSFHLEPWRYHLMYFSLPGLLGALVMCALPESPRFLLSVGHKYSCLKVMDWICRLNRGMDLKTFFTRRPSRFRDDITMVSKLDSFITIKSQSIARPSIAGLMGDTRRLFLGSWRWMFIGCIWIQFCLFFVSNGLGLWYPTIRYYMKEFPGHSVCDVFSPNNSAIFQTGCTDKLSSVVIRDSVILGGCNVIFYLIQGVALHYLRSKLTFFIIIMLSMICGLAFLYISDFSVTLFLLISFLVLPGVSTDVILIAIIDMLPTSSRGKGVCLAALIGRVGVILGTQSMGHLVKHSCVAVFSFCLFLLISCLLIASSLPFGSLVAVRRRRPSRKTIVEGEKYIQKQMEKQLEKQIEQQAIRHKKYRYS